MKNVLLVLAAVLSLTACNKDDGSTEATQQDVVTTDVGLAEDVTAAAADVTAVDVPVSTTPVVSEPVDATSVED